LVGPAAPDGFANTDGTSAEAPVEEDGLTSRELAEQPWFLVRLVRLT